MTFDIDKVKRKLLVKYPSFGSIVANLDYSEDVNCKDYNGNPTAGTNGSIIAYHPDFINSLTEAEQLFIIAHEVCHVAFDHIKRSLGKDPEVWNIATDAVVNAFLKHDGLTLLSSSIDMEEAINYDAEQMYQMLLERKKQNQQDNQNNKNSNNQNNQNGENDNNQDNSNMNSKNNQNNSSQNSSNKEESDNKNHDVGHDTHSMWNNNLDKNKQNGQNNENKYEQSNNKNDSNMSNDNQSSTSQDNDKQLNNESNKNNQNSENKTKEGKTEKQKQIEKQVQETTKLGEKEAFKQNRIEKRKQLEELKQELARQSHNAGVGTNNEKRNIDNIGLASPLIDWYRLLKECIKYDIDWSYKNASIEDGVVTPYLEEIPRPETEILLDTSGSISEVLLRNFLRECKNILQVSKVKVGCFDDTFHGFTEIRNENDIDNMTFVGNGGTNFDAAVNAFTRRVENKIIFTDGEANMPSMVVDAIWIVFGGKRINPPGGKVIYISDEQLDKLMGNSKTR